MKVTVDQDLCAGALACADYCPEVFEIDMNDKAQVLIDPIPPQFEEQCRKAAEQCPTQAIKIQETAKI